MNCPYCSEKLQVCRIDDSEYRFHCVFCLTDVNPKEIVPDKKVEGVESRSEERGTVLQ